MSSTIRVAEVSELPPGKGRVVEVGGRHFAVFNRDGRFYATGTHAFLREPDAGDTSRTCTHHGLEFDVYTEDSPARLLDEEQYRVEIEDETIWLVVD
jgi:nitrite reductase/ring-hydroxylating ferredoxin subunit